MVGAIRFVIKCPKCGETHPVMFTKHDLQAMLKIIKTQGQAPIDQLPSGLRVKRTDG